ncbi:MAG: iron ABC transporter permease [Calditrichia bacterium]
MKMKNFNKPGIFLVLSFFFLLLVGVITLFIGSEKVEFREVFHHVFQHPTVDGQIFFQVRLPRILLAILTGATLSLAGLVFQALLRNPLATPYTLGVSSGGALGAVLMFKLGLDLNFLGFSTVQTAAFLGSLTTVTLVYLLASRSGRISIYTMILAGVTVSYFFGAVILMVHYFADFTETRNMIRWMMGGLDISGYRELVSSSVLIFPVVIVLFYHARMLNIVSTSHDTALSKGVSVGKVQRVVFVGASLITGMAVAISGPIGFVGLIIPHFLRLSIGVDHRYLIPASLMVGGAFLTLCDTLARTLLAPVDIPVGIITAILGGPFFLWLLMKRKGEM